MFVLRTDQLDGKAVPANGAAFQANAAGAQGVARHRPEAHEVIEPHGPLAAPGRAAAAQPVNRQPSAAILPPFASTFAVRFNGANAAVECPKHIADAQALIDRVGDRMARDEQRMQIEVAGLIHALLDDARMLLGAARLNHEQPHGPFDHARAYAKTDAALGHARAAELLYSRCSHPQGHIAAMSPLRP